MNNIIPFFEIDGIRYEIRPTRYLFAEYNKISEQSNIGKEDKANALKIEALASDVQRYAEKTKELEEKYFETFDEEDERKYLKAKSLYDFAFEKLAEFETSNDSSVKIQKESINMLEKVAIKGIAEQYFDFDESKAKKLWESWVDTLINREIAVEWLVGMSECLFFNEKEVEDNSFLGQMRKKAEKQAINRKNGLKKK